MHVNTIFKNPRIRRNTWKRSLKLRFMIIIFYLTKLLIKLKQYFIIYPAFSMACALIFLSRLRVWHAGSGESVTLPRLNICLSILQQSHTLSPHPKDIQRYCAHCNIRTNWYQVDNSIQCWLFCDSSPSPLIIELMTFVVIYGVLSFEYWNIIQEDVHLFINLTAILWWGAGTTIDKQNNNGCRGCDEGSYYHRHLWSVR